MSSKPDKDGWMVQRDAGKIILRARGPHVILNLKHGFALFLGGHYLDTFETLGDAKTVADYQVGREGTTL